MDDIPVVESANDVGSQSSKQLVKSNAVVKYSAVNAPASFARLQFNTDLKTPPSNWLSSNGDIYGLNHALSHSSGFSSFRMAHMFPDCVGEVDVVSDAENIKKLLKIPYSTSPVSMMVHRVENTLLIDEFDIHKHLLSRAESDWAWLKKFFREHILQTLKSKGLFYKNNSRNTLQQKSLVSKFLHYSLAESKENNVTEVCNNTLPLTMRGPPLPEPPLEEGLPDSSIDHKFTRNVVWTFEDIQMLLGTDMPIFGGSTRPCISLRLRDATKPISVLTGIDYWLDNLMSNVPEVVMCYHLDGIVQKYELIKTEDLPHLPESKFSPKLIRDVAQNILSFLKANATKAGHTYWLFKGKNEDAVKLYDLTSLCSDSLEEKDQNPFIVPVGMLLYRVARNMRACQENSVNQIATIRMLLKNCLKLLSKEKYPEIVLSAHYMLSDVYIPCETDPCCPHLEDIPSPPEQTDEEVESCLSNSVPVTSLCVTNFKTFSAENKYQAPPPIVGSIEERCKASLQHVLEGLDCLQYFKINSEKDADKTKEEPKMANPSEPIPMPFPEQDNEQKGKKKKKEKGLKVVEEENQVDQDHSLKALLCRTNAETLPKWQKPEKVDSASWKKHLSSLLYVKACLVYSILVEREIQNGRFAQALKHIAGVLKCCPENKALAGLMLQKAGDCLYALCREKPESFDVHDDYPEVHRPPPFPHHHELNLIPKEFESPLSIISACICCYKRSLELSPSTETIKRLGSAYNELGNAYNNLAAEMLKGDEHISDSVKFAHCIMEAESLLQEGLKVLQSIGDNVNTALVMCNIGRLWRLKAHSGYSLGSAFDNYQKNIYAKAVESYNQALESIGSRKVQPYIWDSIAWELSTTLYMMATHYQENPQAQGEEAEREAIELLHKALQQCDLSNDTPKLPLYQFRAASLHYRIASLCHNSIRKNVYDEVKRKNKRALCDLHYGKAFEIYSLLKNPVDLLRIQLERLSLSEYFANEAKSAHKKIKYYEEALGYLKECRKAFVLYEKANKKSGRKGKQAGSELSTDESADEIINLMEERLQHIVKSLIKLYMSSPKSSEKTVKYKEIYRVILLKEKDASLSSHFIKVIDKILEEFKN